jgi:hypothetical protein
VAVLPSYLNALAGKGVHVVTVNDYLARRDSEWVGQVPRFLGMQVRGWGIISVCETRCSIWQAEDHVSATGKGARVGHSMGGTGATIPGHAGG